MAGRKFLLVEGADDARVIGSILKRKQFPEVFRIEENGGVDKLLDAIPIFVKSSEIDTIGVVVDADFEVKQTWERLRGILTGVGYKEVPQAPISQGAVLCGERLPRFGLWLMPNNHLPGMLEDFVRLLIDPENTLKSHAEAAVDKLPDCEGRFKEVHKTKAVIHTWLAWQENPGTPMGSAITYKYLNTENEHVAMFVGWLTRLFTNQSG